MKKYVFVGNRFYVLKAMMDLNCNIIKIYSVKNSFLSRELDKLNIPYELVESKNELINNLKNLEYDILVSNGCPYILPISKLQDGKKLFINVHPSLLPDLKGKSPINGALLFDRRHGVTCHYMDDGIDTGDIIDQIEIDTKDIRLPLLYRLSFMMEGEVFKKAFSKNFSRINTINDVKSPLYYSRSEQDSILTIGDSSEKIMRKVRAFGIEGQYAKIVLKDNSYFEIIDANVIENKNVKKLFQNNANYSICDIYDNCILCRYNDDFLEMEVKDFALKKMYIGQILFE